MDINKLTQKSQEALAEAQSIATRMGHIEVDGEHLLMALIDQPEGLVPRLLDQAGADTAALRADLERELNRRPKVSGPGAAPGQVSVTRRLANAAGGRRAGSQAAQGRLRVGGASGDRARRRGFGAVPPDGFWPPMALPGNRSWAR